MTADQIFKAVEIALDFIRTTIAQGKDPLVEMQKLVDVHPKLDQIRGEFADAMDKKFGK